DVVRRWRERSHDRIPLQIGGERRTGPSEGVGHDPSRPGRVAYRYALGGPADVDRALTVARTAQPAWAARSIAERGARLEACAAQLARPPPPLLRPTLLARPPT